MSIRIDRPDSDRKEDRGVVVKIDYDACESAGTCVLVCPEEVFEHRAGHTTVLDASKCTECWICVENCNTGAIEIS